MSRDRLRELDGLRAAAILSVIAFHYTARFPAQYYPYPRTTIFQLGWLGVHLFFVISGFVIALTLLTCRSVWEYVVRRWSRLTLPMVVCSLITFAVLALTNNAFAELRRAHTIDFLPSWTFTQPAVWQWLDPHIKYVDGVYWSLYYEVRFYFWAGVFFFLTGPRSFALGFSSFAAASWLGYITLLAFVPATATLIFETLFISKYVPLFCAGVLFHELYRGNRQWWTLAAIFCCFVAASLDHSEWRVTLILAGIFGVFFMLVYRRAWLSPLTNRVAVGIGLASYSLYLLHDNMGLAVMNEFPRAGYAAAAIATTLVFGASGIVYGLIERNTSRVARAILLLRRPRTSVRPAEGPPRPI